jgi:sialate O-acetylesterase
MPVPVWGKADPGSKITVRLGSQEKQTVADAKGKWKVILAAMKAGGPHEMTVSGKNTVSIKNILIGEVWICSGQSNMKMRLFGANDGKTAVPDGGYPQIRLFKVTKKASTGLESDVEGSWKICEGRAAIRFSAVGFYFGREIHEQIKVPVGLIQAAVNATKIKAWTPREGGLWNGMVRPLVPFAIRGAIWYQGESNVSGPAKYDLKMKALISGWRSAWAQGDFPFYFVQLPPYRYNKKEKSDERLCLLREAQVKSLSIPNTGMAVTTDLVRSDGPPKLHPKKKKDVGRRLALWPLARDYGFKETVFSGPLYKSMSVEGGKARIAFDHVGSGLATRDGKSPDWFEIAGQDRKFVKADAKIDGNSVLVWSEAVPAPTAVRLGWHQEAQPNLINKEGLPASPFRTHKRQVSDTMDP